MGIKFLCDRCGKKLNVKSFLAGKRGICPKCGAKVEIPADPDESVAEAGYSGVEASVASAGYSTGPTPAQQASQPVAAPTPQVAYSASPVATTTVATPTAVPSAAPTGVQGAGLATSPGTADPIAVAPNAMWYVRPVSGGQYGPANGDLLRHWIDQGRVGADSLVWREGWADWQQANLLFPQMGAPAAAPTAALTPTPTSPTMGTEAQPTSSLSLSTEPRSGGYRRPHRRSNSMSITIMVILSVVAVGLIAGLIYVVLQG